MSNRFHNKFHRQNHHSDPTPGYPDSAMDPIASFEQPFKGEFYSQGDIVTTQNLSAGINLNVTNNTSIFGTSVRTPNIGTDEDNSVVILNSSGNLKTDEINSGVWNTTMKFVSASDGALTVNRLTKATDSTGINESIVFDNGTNVGIGSDAPTEKLHVQGNIKITGTVEAANIGTGEDNTVVILDVTGKLRTDEINPSVWDTTAKFVSASDGALTVNRLTKATDFTGINESIVTDDGTLVSVGGNFSTTGTATVGTIATNAIGTSVLVETTGLVQKRTLNVAAFDTTSKFVSASDGDLNTGFIPKATNATGLDQSLIYDTGTNVGIGTITPGAKLTVNGTLSTSGTATIGTIATNATGNSFVVETEGLLQKRVVNIGAMDTTAVFVSASDGALSVNYLPKATNSNGINESIVYDDGTNIGIGETSPEGKLHVKAGSSGTVTAQPNSIGIFENSGNAYISVLSPTSQYAGLVMGGPGNPYGSYVSWNHDNNALKVATAHSGGAIQLLVNVEQEAVRILSGGNVGIGTTNPKEKLTISGNLSSSGTATIGTITTNSTNTSFVVESNGLLQKRALNVAAGNTTATFVSASDGALSVNYLTKATDSNGINESIISDNGSLVYVGGNVTISGNLTALGNSYFANTLFTTTSSISVVNYGTGPAIYAFQSSGNQDIASFYDGDGVEVLHVGNCPPGELYGKVGINESEPNKELTVRGSVSASGTLNIGTINTNATSDSIVVLGTNNILEKRTIDSRAWGSSLVDGTGTANRVAYWTDSNTIAADEDFFFDGTNVGIGTTTPGVKLNVEGTAAVNYLRVDAQDGSNEGGEIQLKGAGANGDVQIDNHAGNVRIHTLGASNYFQINGGGSTTALRVENGGAYIGNIATGTTNSVIIESSGTLQKRSIDSRAWGSSLVDGAGTTNYVTKWSDADTITNSQIFDNGTDVGVGTNTPGVKLDVNGIIRSNNEIIGSALGGSGQARYISGNYGIIHRNDGSDYYILKTASGDQYGGWDSSRPFVINLNTGNVGIGSDADNTHKLNVTGNIRSTNVIIPGSSTVTPVATTGLPSCNDVILNNQTGPVTITAFSGGVAGATYTITNKSTHAVTLDTSASLFVRGGNSWASHKCTTNAEGYIVLPQNFSCSLRMDSSTSGSAW